jgi:gluconate 2-dehydrogenase gamma chain
MQDFDIGNGTNPELLEADTGWPSLSRRELLIGAGLVGIALQGVSAATENEPLQSFNASEAVTVRAILARLIPTDENGPGAIEARVDRYIDRLLRSHNAYRGSNDPNVNMTDAYAAGLKAIDAYAQTTQGGPFASLSPDKQDAILTAMQANSATGFTPNSRTFFNLIRRHTVEGMFGDPYYGGNANFAGWDLLDYPGVKLVFTEEEQKLDVIVKKAHKSTTDYAFFGDNRKGM